MQRRMGGPHDDTAVLKRGIFFHEQFNHAKIVLGTLMTLVLAFSVPGIVDAQSVSVSGDGSTTSTSSGTTVITDYRTTPAVERSFTIRVSSAKTAKLLPLIPRAQI